MHVGIGKCARIFPARKRRSTRRCVFVFRAFFASVPGGRNMSHTIAGIDVHKKLLVVVIADEAKTGCAFAEPPVWHRIGRIASSVSLAKPVWRCGSGNGEHCAVLEAGLDGTGAASAVASGASSVQ